MEIYKLVIVLTTIFLVASCGCKTKLDSNDLAWFTYQEGDTLVFCSSDNKFDTTFIVKREIFYPEYNPIEVHGKYHPQMGNILYYNKNVPYINDGKELVFLEKNIPEQKATGFISYYNSTFFFDKDFFIETNYTAIINGKQYNDILLITYNDFNLDCDILRKLWWSKKHGLLEYETCEGQIWTRIK